MERLPLIFDSHSHYDDERYEGLLESLLPEMERQKVGGILTCGTDISSSKKCIEIAEKFDFVWAAVGYHPTCIDAETQFDAKTFEELIKHPKVKVIGEIGLDYYWDTSLKAKQLELFDAQLAFANLHNLPVSVHDREAHQDTFDLLKKHKPQGVVHCYSGSYEMAKELLKLGLYIGVGGVLTFKNAKKTVEVIKEIPIEKLLIETDAPYLTPEPYRSKINNSAYLIFVAKKIAEIKDLSVEEVLSTTYKNAFDLFRI